MTNLAVTSALGFLVAAPAIDYVRSYVSRLEQINWSHLNALFSDLQSEARTLLIDAGAKPEEIPMMLAADISHVGQGFEISAPVPGGPLDETALPLLRQAFFGVYQQLFERTVRDVLIDAMSWRLVATAPVPNVRLNFGGQPIGAGASLKGTRPVYCQETGFADCHVYDRYALRPGDNFSRPAVVEERESTTVIGPGATVNVDAYLNVICELS